MISSSSPEVNYFNISHTNNTSTFTTEEIFIYLSRLCGTFQAIDEISFGNEINDLFSKIIPENTSNILKFNQILSSKNKDTFTIPNLENSMNILLNQSYSNEIILSEHFSSFISSIMSYCFNKIKQFKIKTYEQLKTAINESLHYEQDIIQEYHKQHKCFQEENKKKGNSNVINLNTSLRSGKDAYIQVDNPNSSLSFQRKDERKRTFDDVSTRQSRKNVLRQSNRSLTSLFHRVTLLPEQKIYHFNLVSKVKNKGSVPDEMVILVNKFQCIRKIKLKLSSFEKGNVNQKQYLYNVIFILSNYEWLFPNLLEIDFDLSNENIYNELKKVYSKLLKKKKFVTKNTNYNTGFNTQREFIKSIGETIDNNDSSNNEDNEMVGEDNDISVFKESEYFLENETNQFIEYLENLKSDFNIQEKVPANNTPFLLNIVNEYISMYDALIVYLYFISKMDKVHVIKLTIPDTFSKDIKLYLKKNQISSLSFYHFNFLFLKSNLYEFTLDFNCLDFQFFDLLSGFIFANKFLRNIRLSFFPIDEYFSPEMLYRLLTSPQKRKLNELIKLKQDNDIDELILEILIPSLEENFNQFFFALEKKRQLNEVVLLFDLPTIIYTNEKYIMILIKFIMNIFLLIKYFKFQSKALNIYAEYLPFNTRKYPFIETFLDDLFLYERQFCELLKLSFHVQFNSVTNIENMIPNSLIYLSIGEFDMETFEEFVLYFTSKEYKSVSKLETIKVSLSKSILQLNETMKLICEMLISYPKTVKVMSISSWLPLIQKTMVDVVKKINYNSLECVIFEFGKTENVSHRLSFSSNYSGRCSSICSGNFVNSNECFYIQREIKQTNVLIELLMRLGKCYNKNILNYGILCNVERFMYQKYLKEITIKTKI